MMSVEKNKAIARRYQEEVWGKGNLALLDELLASDYVDHSLPATMDPSFAGAKAAAVPARPGRLELHGPQESVLTVIVEE